MKREKQGEKDTIFRGKEWYRKKIVEMVDQISNERYLKMIYGYIRSAYREENGGD